MQRPHPRGTAFVSCRPAVGLATESLRSDLVPARCTDPHPHTPLAPRPSLSPWPPPHNLSYVSYRRCRGCARRTAGCGGTWRGPLAPWTPAAWRSWPTFSATPLTAAAPTTSVSAPLLLRVLALSLYHNSNLAGSRGGIRLQLQLLRRGLRSCGAGRLGRALWCGCGALRRLALAHLAASEIKPGADAPPPVCAWPRFHQRRAVDAG